MLFNRENNKKPVDEKKRTEINIEGTSLCSFVKELTNIDKQIAIVGGFVMESYPEKCAIIVSNKHKDQIIEILKESPKIFEIDGQLTKAGEQYHNEQNALGEAIGLKDQGIGP